MNRLLECGTLKRQYRAIVGSTWLSAVLRSRFVIRTCQSFKICMRMASKGHLIYSDRVRSVAFFSNMLSLTVIFLCRSVIQGTVDADVANSVTQDEVYKVFELCSKSFTPVKPHEKEALFAKLEALGFGESDQQTFTTEKLRDLPKNLTADELQALRILQTRRLTIEDPFEMDSFTLDPINGMVPNLVRGSLGLVKADQGKIDKKSLFSLSFLRGKEHRIREG